MLSLVSHLEMSVFSHSDFFHRPCKESHSLVKHFLSTLTVINLKSPGKGVVQRLLFSFQDLWFPVLQVLVGRQDSLAVGIALPKDQLCALGCGRKGQKAGAGRVALGDEQAGTPFCCFI